MLGKSALIGGEWWEEVALTMLARVVEGWWDGEKERVDGPERSRRWARHLENLHLQVPTILLFLPSSLAKMIPFNINNVPTREILQ